ncbi:Protein kinase-like domain [Pseudocohnilembus persalinus]|uniref:Protein kinase-like domain n=1 Tax=Pseudocohnilembus persalinus TaxID=266149 RepID=A0A0V0QS83_PSEPJ|nr:Protein kinase-like domain [Pseudocohnilembus persalinus]|eukprot:KRX05094.1 Protein kinase-like domain [Pseudocohnilembus persalinus]
MENQSQIKINLNQYSYIIKLEEQRENNIFGPIYKLEKILRDNRSVKYTWTCQLIKKNELSVQKQNEFQKLYQLYKKNQFDRENGCLIQVQDEPVLSDTQNNVYIYEYFKKRIYTYIEEEFQQKFKSVNSDMLKPLIKRIILCYKALYDKKQNLNKDVQPQLQNLIIHGNITPENIVSNSQGQIKIKGYFGNQINDVFLQNLNRSKKFWRAYLAPEIFTNLNSIISQNKNSHALEKIDIYALGVIFYRILYQQLPKFDLKTKQVIFSQESKNEKQQNVSNIETILKKLIQKCLSHNPADRLNAQQLFTFLETKEINFIQPTENLFTNKEENGENKEIIKILFYETVPQLGNAILIKRISEKMKDNFKRMKQLERKKVIIQ